MARTRSAVELVARGARARRRSSGFRITAYYVFMSGRKLCLEQPIISENLEVIRALGREFGVLRLEVFGSVCTPEFDPETSDVDFLVEYPDDYEFGPWISRYFAFKESLSRLLGRPVDLVMASAPRNPYFVRSINRTRQLLYAA